MVRYEYSAAEAAGDATDDVDDADTQPAEQFLQITHEQQLEDNTEHQLEDPERHTPPPRSYTTAGTQH